MRRLICKFVVRVCHKTHFRMTWLIPYVGSCIAPCSQVSFRSYLALWSPLDLLIGTREWSVCFSSVCVFEPRHDKTNKVSVRPAKTQISLCIRPIWSKSSLSTWRKLGSIATHWAHSEDSYQTGWMPRLIWVFAGRTLTLLVLSCCGSFLLRTLPC